MAPDVPDGGLLVQGGVGDPQAYAAVAFVLAVGETAEALELQVHEGSASTPGASLALCALTESFTPEHGGPAAGGPSYDCEDGVEAGPSDDGSSYSWPVPGVSDLGIVAVAIVPTAPTDRVVLSPPDTSALRTTAAASPGGPTGSAPPSTPAADGGDFDMPEGSGPSFESTSPSFGPPQPAAEFEADPRPSVALEPAGDAGAARPGSSGEQAAPPVATAGSDDVSPVNAFGLVLVASLAGMLWWAAGGRSDDHWLAGDAEPAAPGAAG